MVSILFLAVWLERGEALEKAVIAFGNERLVVELAETPADQARGLMFRERLEPGTGMLFVFADSQEREFWMKNTFVALSLAFIHEDYKVFQLSDLDPGPAGALAPPRVRSKGPARFVLEVPKGWFVEKQITVGVRMKIISAPKSTLLWKFKSRSRT